MRICTICNEEKELNKENFQSRENGLFRRECKSCTNKRVNKRNAIKLKDKRQARQAKLDKELELFNNGYKTCGCCKQELTLVQFNKQTNGKFGLESHCRNCKQKAKDKRYIKRQEALRVCKTCGLKANNARDLELFVIGKNNRFGRSPQCKSCKNNSEASRASNTSLKKRCAKFGITVEDYNSMIESQENRCAICNKHKDRFTGRGNNFHIDHCHDTGKVRGLLCSSCNTGLGHFKDDVISLQKAILYITINKA